MTESPHGTDEVLRRLEDRLEQASEAAEQLIAQATVEADDAKRRTPPAGWQAPEPEEERGRSSGELDAIVHALAALRGVVPPDLERRVAEALRELLLALRALLDWYIERLEQRRTAPVEVQDIPIL